MAELEAQFEEFAKAAQSTVEDELDAIERRTLLSVNAIVAERVAADATVGDAVMRLLMFEQSNWLALLNRDPTFSLSASEEGRRDTYTRGIARGLRLARDRLLDPATLAELKARLTPEEQED